MPSTDTFEEAYCEDSSKVDNSSQALNEHPACRQAFLFCNPKQIYSHNQKSSSVVTTRENCLIASYISGKDSNYFWLRRRETAPAVD